MTPPVIRKCCCCGGWVSRKCTICAGCPLPGITLARIVRGVREVDRAVCRFKRAA